MAISINTGIRAALIEGVNLNKARDFTDILGDVINEKGFFKKLDENFEVVDNQDGTITIKKGVAFVKYTKSSGDEGFVKCELGEDKVVDISGEADGTYYVSIKLNQDVIDNGANSVSGDDVFSIEIDINEYDLTIGQIDKNGSDLTITDKRERVNIQKITTNEVQIGNKTLQENVNNELEINGNIKANNFIGSGAGLTDIQSETAKMLTIKGIAGENLVAGDKVIWLNDAGNYKIVKTNSSNLIGVVLRDANAGEEVEIIVRGPISLSGYGIGTDIFFDNGDFTDVDNGVWVGKIIAENILYLSKTNPGYYKNTIVGSSLETDLLAWYDFEGNGNDDTGNHNGTVNGGISFVEGVDGGQAIVGNNSDSYINLGTNPFSDITSQFTISFWGKVGADTGDIEKLIGFAPSSSSVAERNTGIGLDIDYRDGNKYISYGTGKGADNSDGSQSGTWDYLPDLNKWFMVIFQMDDTDITIKIRYQDGTEQVFTDTVRSGNILWNTSDYAQGNNAIGANYNSSSWTNFIADTTAIDKVGVWKRILTSEEIDYLFNGGYGLVYSN